MNRILPVAAVLSCLAAMGCGLSCTDMYAPSGVVVEVDGGTWTPGRYELELNGYNQFALCVIDLPDDGALPPACTANAEVVLDEAGEAIVMFYAENFAPEGFSVELRRDGEVVAEDQVVPAYEVDEPNGPGCGERRVATVTFSP